MYKYTFVTKFSLCFIILIFFLLTNCKSFMYGLTEENAFGRYMKVNKSPKSFGYKRLRYNQGHHGKFSDLNLYIKNMGLPEYIHEKNDSLGCDIIIIYYSTLDSAYTFKEQNNRDAWSSIFIGSRKINSYEKSKFTCCSNY